MSIAFLSQASGCHFERGARNPETSMLDANKTCSGPSIGIPRAAATRGNDNGSSISALDFRLAWLVLRTRGGLFRSDSSL